MVIQTARMDLIMATRAATARFVALRRLGPAFVAVDGARVIVGSLGALPPPRSWADVVQAAGSGRSGLAVGYLAYEAGAWVERIATVGEGPVPLSWFGRCEAVWARGGAGGSWIGSDEAIQATRRVGSEPIEEVGPSGAPPEWSPAGPYRDAVESTLRSIREGECYQVNLAREVHVRNPGDPVQAWLRLARDNPSRRAMLLDTGSFTIVSNSPELLLAARGRSLLSIPIKGTRPASVAPEVLLRSQKERAELTMIVDLVRADLGRVARPGSVYAGPRRVGRVGHLWHAMQRVHAELEEGRTAVDALGALFPAGSVTGAPRIRATELIARHEGRPRGVYCGTMGWFGADDTASWNVAIRTMTFLGPQTRPDVAVMHFGSGIVWGSDPRRECIETEWKARRMLAALCR